mgnify:CR=1 FL=1
MLSPMRIRRSLLLLALMLSALAIQGCGHTMLSTEALFEKAPGRLVVSLPNLSCATCGHKVANAVKALPGVHQAAFAMHSVEVGVAYDVDSVTEEAILEASNSVGERAVLGAGKGAYEPPVEHDPETDTVLISRGEEVVLSEHIVPGKVTVVDFYADWCGPCRRVAVVMNAIMAERDDVAFRKIDIVDWDTPVVKQHMKEVSRLPYTIVFDQAGNEVKRIVGLDIPGLNAAIEEGAK